MSFAITYSLIPQNTIIAGIPAQFVVAPIGFPSGNSIQVVVIVPPLGAGPGPVYFDTSGAPQFINFTFPSGGTYYMYSQNNNGLTDPYTVGSPLVLSVQNGPLYATQPNTVIGTITSTDGQGNPASGVKYTFDLISEPIGSIVGGSTTAFTTYTNGSGIATVQLVTGWNYYGQRSSGKIVDILNVPSGDFYIPAILGP